jgi:hypothetical protein
MLGGFFMPKNDVRTQHYSHCNSVLNDYNQPHIFLNVTGMLAICP